MLAITPSLVTDGASRAQEPQQSYISIMISLDRNLSETWNVVNHSPSRSRNSEERVEFLNFQLQKIVDRIPTGDFESLESTVAPPLWLQAGLKKFCHLRVHHIKFLIQISAYGSIRDAISNPTSTDSVVTAAIKSIDLHFEMENSGGISPLMLPIMTKLLLTSLSIMMFIVSCRPNEYMPLCRKPFETATSILSDVQRHVKDEALNIPRTLHVLDRIIKGSQMSQFHQPVPLISRKEDIGNNINQDEKLGEGSIFEELPTPESEFFTVLGAMGATDILHMPDNIFG